MDNYPYDQQRQYRDAGQQPYRRCRLLVDGQPSGPDLEFISYPWAEERVIDGTKQYILFINVRDLRRATSGGVQGDPTTLRTVRCADDVPWNPPVPTPDATQPTAQGGVVGKSSELPATGEGWLQ